MRVCILTTSFPRFKRDSAGIFIYHLSRWLVKKGVNIDVIAPHDPGCQFTDHWENIRIHRFPYFYPLRLQRLCYGFGIIKNIQSHRPAILQLPFLCASEFFYSFALLKKIRPDIIHAHWSLPQGLIGIMAKRILNIPCVTSIHGSDMFGLTSPFFKSLNAMVVRNSDACTANSRATAGVARNMSGKDDIIVVPMGVDTHDFTKTDAVAHLKIKFNIEGPVVLFVGRLIDLKGIVYLIRAIPDILQQFPGLKTLIIGCGPQKDELMRLADAKGIRDHIIFIDEVSQEELVPFYSMADIFVLPSIVNQHGETEGFGVVLLEAMACELPVIASNVGGISDIIRDEDNGLLVRQKDPQAISSAIIRLLSDAHLRKKIVANGFQIVNEKFSWSVISDRFIKIYQEID